MSPRASMSVYTTSAPLPPCRTFLLQAHLTFQTAKVLPHHRNLFTPSSIKYLHHQASKSQNSKTIPSPTTMCITTTFTCPVCLHPSLQDKIKACARSPAYHDSRYTNHALAQAGNCPFYGEIKKDLVCGSCVQKHERTKVKKAKVCHVM